MLLARCELEWVLDLPQKVFAAGGDLAVWTGHGCDSKYLAYLMYSPQLIFQKAATGNGNVVVHTSVKKLQQLEIPLPPLPVQREIVARLERELTAVEKMMKDFSDLLKQRYGSISEALSKLSFPTLDHALSYYSDIQHWLYAA